MLLFVEGFSEHCVIFCISMAKGKCRGTVGAALLIISTLYDMIKENKAYLSDKKNGDSNNENG